MLFTFLLNKYKSRFTTFKVIKKNENTRLPSIYKNYLTFIYCCLTD